ncbi:MAG: J domain-containing protein, partial [Treponema sp.]|nr:J domain-containing protein [Treponema sp.]
DFSDLFGGMGGGFSDIFENLFGGGFGSRQQRNPAGPMQGASLRYDLSITFKEAVFGTKKEIRFRHNEICSSCNGSGGAAGSSKKTCSSCGGTGQIRRSAGFFSVQQTCSACHGEGTTIDKPCPSCRGSGVQAKSKMMTLTIPQGVDNGKRISIPRQGDAGTNGGEPGDLIVILHVESDEHFERADYDLYCAIPLTLAQVTLGVEITVTALDGKKISLKVPAGTANGKLLRIKGEGVPVTNSTRRGDLYVKIVVQVPTRITSEQKKLLEQYLKLESATTSPSLIALSDLAR